MVGGVHRGERSRKRQRQIEQGEQVASWGEQRGVADIGDDCHDLLDGEGPEPIRLGRVERELAARGQPILKNAVTDREQQGQVRYLNVGELRMVHGVSLGWARAGRGVGFRWALS